MQHSEAAVNSNSTNPVILGWLGLNVAIPGLFVAVILLSNYALSGIPNVKLFDLFVFIAGYKLGFRRGSAVAVMAWLVYGQINPWGVAAPHLIVTLMVAETLYAGAGSCARRLITGSGRFDSSLKTIAVFGVCGLIATGLYDVVTNAYTGYIWAAFAGSNEYGRWIWIGITNPGAIFFMAVHGTANVAFFTVFGLPFARMTERGLQIFKG